MALTAQQSNFVSRVIAAAEDMRDLRYRLDDLEGQWFGNGHNANISEADLLAVFPHLTSAELTGLIVALIAVRDVLVVQKDNLVKAVG